MLNGLNSNDPQVRAWAENTRDDIEARINDLTQLLGQDGTDAGQAFTQHLRGQIDNAAAAASALAARVNAALAKIVTNIKINIVGDEQYGHGRGPDKKKRALGGPVSKGIAYIVGERRPELFIPDSDGTILPQVPPRSKPNPFYQASPAMALAVNVQLSTRGFDRETRHYDFIQGRTR
jgi:hypothetical protein